MTPACPRLLLALLPWCAAAALAQQPAPAPGKEAMERARRDAANPMRVILEAGRLQQRRRAEAAPAAVPAPVPAAPPTTASPPTPARVAAPVVVAEPAPAPPLPEPAAPLVAQPPAEAPPASPAAEVEVQPPPVPTVEPEVVVEPTLLDLVEPAIPPGVLGRVGALREVTADLSLRSDGTVAAVALAPATPRAVARYLTQALAQWRFAPLPEARVHRVQLVFNP